MAAPATEAFVAVRASTRAPRADTAGSALQIAACVALLVLVAAPLPYLLRFDHGHYGTALVLALTLVACSFYSQRGAIVATMLFLAILGDYRRYAGHFEGYPQSDPLLLVAPAIALLLLGQALLRGRSSSQTVLSRLVLALMLLMAVEMFNPAQGGISIGLAGALFYLAPLLWFWVARAFASVEFAERFTLWVVVSVGTAAMLLGLYQSYFGLLPFEQQWVDQIGYQALYIAEGVVRAIGFFSSSAEYQHYLVVTSIALFALWLTKRSLLIILLPLFLAAIFLSAARGPLIMTLAGMAFVWAIAARNVGWWLPRLGIATAIGAAALIATLTLLQGSSLQGRIAPLVERQVGGLLDPTNPEKSTASGHLEMIKLGLAAGVLSPAGEGLGATTVAAEKYGALNRNAEVDFANLMISLGILGGVLYLVILVTVLARAISWWRAERPPQALVIIGMLMGTLGGWLIGGEYSIAALLWFQIGLMDRLSRDAQRARQRSRAHAPGPDHP